MKAKDEKMLLWTLPNRLSIIRILFIPIIIICMEKGLPFPAFLLFLIAVCREFLINGLRSFYAMEGITIYPSFSGKLKTMLQIVGIACILFDLGSNFLLSNMLLDRIGLYILYGALFFSIFSAWNYIAAIFKEPSDR